MKELNQNLWNLFKGSGFIIEQLIITCFAIRHELSIQYNTDHLIWLSSQGFIIKKQNKLLLTVPLYQEELTESLEINDSLSDEDVDRYRKLFKGIRLGSMGNKTTVKEYLERFIIEYNVTIQEILDIVENYTGMSDQTYIPNADNFIYRLKGDREISSLALLLEEGDTTNTKLKLLYNYD